MMTKALVALCAIASAVPAAARCRDGDNVSWYGEPQRLRGGGRFNPEAMTCAHPDAPDGSIIRVTMEDGSAAECVVNDLGPNRWTGCKVDVSRAMARRLGLVDRGVGRGTIQVLRFLRNYRRDPG